ncbi:NAD-dependent epimerase/dehydratase family protein [Rhodopseudomonas palustris]|uniref:NAD-dependent epimerase/dehydratase n=1 Tax=Rhodopseudomonas palustris (strain BisB18) TaxID=316056 RepID=Q20YP5_RHOPB
MNVLVTGNLGYVGAVLVPYLRARHPGSRIVCYDTGYFAHCITSRSRAPESYADLQYFGDIRDLPDALIAGTDAIVQLSAISNDPIGNDYEKVTIEINETASLDLARRARDAGVRSFVFASSCSAYGFAEGDARRESDALNPLTAYARSKVGTERGLAGLQNGEMTITALRFATACGMSPRLRLDLVLNDFVACALSSGEITVLSDGSPWRPLIDVSDMARAIDWAIQRDRSAGGPFVAVNAGSNAWNYQVRDLAQAVADAIPGTKVSINRDAPPDKRSYRVNFDLFAELAQGYTPTVTLTESIERLVAGMQELGFADANFRNSQFMRLQTIRKHRSDGLLDADLRWTN